MDETKYAIRKLFRLDDGTVGVFYVDADTGEILDSLDGYELVTAGNLEDFGTNSETPAEDQDQGDDTETEGRAPQGAQGGGGGSTPVNWRKTVLGDLLGVGEFPPAPQGPRLTSQQIESLPRLTDTSKIPVETIPVPIGVNNNQNTEYERETTGTGAYEVTPKDWNYSNDTWGPSGQEVTRPTSERVGNTVSADKSAPVDVSFLGRDSTTRNQSVDDKTLQVASISAQNILGDGAYAVVNSGGQDPKGTEDARRTGSTRHDLTESGTSPTADVAYFRADGTPATQEEMALIAADGARMGQVGIGYGMDYMGQNVLHQDPYGGDWGAKVNGVRQPIGFTPEEMATINKARDQYGMLSSGNVPIPAERPQSSSFLAEAPEDQKTTAQKIKESVTGIPDDVDVTQFTPAEMAKYGALGLPDAGTLAAQARTIAGEAMPQTVRAAISGDPSAMAELNTIIATMNNRAAAGDGDVLRGSMYNANLPQNADVTDDNYALLGDDIENYLTDYYSGNNQGYANVAATHYYNPNKASPSWGPLLSGAEQLGYHRFGSLPGEYAPSESFNSSKTSFVEGVATSRINSQASLGGMDNTSLTSTSPFSEGSGSGSSGQDYSGAGMLSGIDESSMRGSSSRGSSSGSNYTGSGGGPTTTSGASVSSYDYSGSSGSGPNSGNSYSPASGSNSPGGSGSNSLISSPPSISSSGGSSSSSSSSGSYYSSTSVGNGGGSDYSSLGSWF